MFSQKRSFAFLSPASYSTFVLNLATIYYLLFHEIIFSLMKTQYPKVTTATVSCKELLHVWFPTENAVTIMTAF